MRGRLVEHGATVGEQFRELFVPTVAGGVRVTQDRFGDGDGFELGLTRRRRADGEAWPA